jgi:cell division protein FtsQ
MARRKPSIIGRIKGFIISRQSFRFARLVFYNKVFPVLKYIFYFLSFLFICTVIYFVFFNKSGLEQIKNRLVNYGYNLIHFGDNAYYNKINISGNQRVSNQDVMQLITKILTSDKNNPENYQYLIEDLQKKIESLPWVDEVVVSRNLQDSLNINIKEHTPFAIWQDAGGRKYIVSKDGKILSVDNVDQFNDLIILAGIDAYKNVKSLFNILAIDPNISQHIYSATWVGNRRWDVRFESDLLVKLPANNISSAWSNLIKIYNMPGSLIGLKTIDLRIAKKIYLEYSDQQTREIKSI